MRNLLVALSLLVASVSAQELCAVNQCAGGQTCYNRNVVGQPSFVCECTQVNTMGYDCTTASDAQVLTTCYGSACASSSFSSINYPNLYENRHRALYLLYIPGATQITFTFDEPFGIETNKDELYVGAGLEFSFDVIDGADSTTNPVDKYFFDSDNVTPMAFTLFNTDVAWMYFLTDRNIMLEGFRIRWSVDSTAPVVSCINDVTATTTTGSTGTTVSWTEPTATDNLGVVTTSRTHTPGSFFGVGTTSVTYTFTDASGNSAICGFNVNVVATSTDTTPPVIDCLQDITATATSDSTAVTWLEPTATDDSGTANLVFRSHTPGTGFGVGTTLVTYIFTDPSNNQASCSFNVIVSGTDVDNIAPVVSCINDVTASTTTGSTGTSVTWTEPTATDNAGGVTTSRTHTPGSFFGVGTTQVTYTFTDGSGNSASCTFNVIVSGTNVDNIAPTVSCINDVTATTTTTGTAVTWTEPTATDNSGGVTTSRTHTPGSFFGVGTTQVTYTFTDGSGNSASCTFSVVVFQVDNIAPVVSCINDVTVTTTTGSTGTSVTWTEPTATDNAGGVTTSRTHTPGSFFGVGTTQVTYTFTDGSGNSASCTFNVNVVATDTVPPTVSCINDVTATTTTGSTGTTVVWTEPTATDNSGATPTSTRTHTPGSFFGVGTTQVTYTFTDGSGNSATCTFNVNVVALDNVAPTVSCINDVTATTTTGSGGTTVTWTEPTATDNSGGVTTSRTHTPGSFFGVGTTQVTYTFTDGSGNSASCTFNVNVVALDGTPPTVSCINDVTATTTTGSGGTTVTWTEPTATDNGGGVTTSRTHTPGSFFGVGTTQVTYTFTDGSGNSASCTFNVNVVALDNVAPTVSCINDVTATTTTGSTGTTVSWTEPTATDNSGATPAVSRTHTPGSFFGVGTTQVTYTFTDGSGNSASCTFNVNVVALDNVAPVVDCTNDVLVQIPIGTDSTPVNWVEPTATDNSGTVTLQSRSHTPLSSFAPGSTLVTYVFADNAGNTATCTFNVIVIQVDSTPPTIACINDVTTTVSTGVGGTTVTWTEPTATDNSGTTTLTERSHAPGSFFAVGSTVVTYTFSDAAGNSASCAFTVTVIATDTVPPTVACINDVTATVGTGVGGTTVTWTEPTAIDNSGATPASTRTHVPGTFFGVGTTQVTYTFTDGSGNTASCTFNVIVFELDTQAPVVSCINDVTSTVGTGVGGTTVTWTEPTAIDNSGATPVISRTHTPGSFFGVGTTAVTYTFTDASGNTASCTFDVRVIELDTVAPVIACINDVSTTVNSGVGGTTVTWTEPTATDNSGTATLGSRTSTPGDFFPVGTTAVTYVFADGTGNVATCTFNVIVIELDTIPPTVSCINDVTTTVNSGVGGTTVTWTEPTATDNSGQETLTSRTHVPGSFFTVGVTTVTYTFIDESSNTATCVFNVNVIELDTIPPTISCINDVTSTVNSGVGGTTVTWTEPTATDNGGTASLSTRTHAPGSFFAVGTTQVTYTFSDNSGNTASCTFNVIVFEIDTIPPTIACINDVTSAVNSNVGGTTVTWTEPTATDNSGTASLSSRTHAPGSFFGVGTTQVTYTFTDASGNSASCSFNVVVIELDTIDPVVSCINDVSATVNTGVGGTTVSWTEPTVTDNSGQVPALSRTHAPGSFFAVGTTQVTYTFTDGSGNSASCTFNVIVFELDTVPPTIACINDVTSTVNSGVGGTTVTWVEPTATDNSGTASLSSRTHSPGSFFQVGTTQVTYTFTDGSGNSASCSFNVIVIELDTIAPIVSCINDVTQTVNSGVGGTTVSWTEPTATDNSGTASLSSRTHAPGTFFPVGSTAVTYTFTDGSGNSATCTFNVLVVELDTIGPVIACINDVTSTVSSGVGGTTVTWTEPTATDNFGTPTLTARSHAPGSFFNVGTTQVTYTYADGAGNSASCSFNVLVIELDTIPPTVSCINDVSTTVNSGVTGTTVTWTEPTATDNSGATPTSSRTHSPGTFFPVGTTAVTYTFTDGSGNSATCTFNVNVFQLDTIPPIVSCINDVTSAVNSGVGGTTVTWTEPTATDNSGTASLSSRTHAPGSFFGVGTTQVTYTFTDGSGNSATCTFNVIVIELDTIAPVVSCINDVTQTVNSGVGGTTVTWVEPTATDNSGTASLSSRTASPGQFFPVGTTQVTYTFTDGSGNSASCTFNVVVIELDTIPPTVSCINDVTSTVNSGVGGTTVTWTEPTATDNGGTASLSTRTHTPGQFFPVGTTQVTYTFTDGSGNSASCTFNVIVIEIDSIPPTIACINDVSTAVNSGSTGTTVTWTEPTATDNSGQVPTLSSRTHSPGTFFPVGTTQVTYTFTDGSGNSASCSFNVFVIELDTVPPTIACINDVTSTVNSGVGGTTVTWVEPTATDNSGTASLSSRTASPGQFFPVGTTQVTYTFTDGSGNSASCTFNVIVIELDTIPPTIACINDVSTAVNSGVGGTTVAWTEPTATDNSGATPAISRTHTPGSFFGVGTTQVTYTFTDGSGNSATCTFNVIVIELDTIPPTIACINDVTSTVNSGVGGTTVSWVEPTATDNSGTAQLSSRTASPGQFFPVGTTQVTYTFTDGSGNSASCTFNVVVIELDTINPVIACINDVSTTVNSGVTGTTVSWTEPTATDNSGIVSLSSRSHAPGSFFPVGTTPVTYGFTDGAGNTATCTFNVVVFQLDTIPPTIACINDVSATVGSGVGGTTVSWTEPTATDNSGQVPNLSSRTASPGQFFQVGTTQVTYTFTDGSGNSASCTFNVIVIELDTIPPTVNCINDVSTTVNLGQTGTTVTWTEPTASDNSGTANLASRTASPGQFFPVGQTQVTYTFIDGSGNSASCTFTINVFEIDTVPPQIACTNDIGASVELGSGGTTVSFVEPTATDNSGTATLQSRTHQPGIFFSLGTTQVTYTFVDPSGNTASCTFDVTVTAIDSEPPTLTCPEDITATVSLGTTGTSVTWINPTATDNSGTASLISNSHDSGSFFPVGTTFVSYIFRDNSGNTASCSFNVIVNAVDTTPPTVTCPDNISRTIPLGTGQISVSWSEPTTSDNSGSVSLVSRSNNPGSFFTAGSTNVIYTYSDPSGNQASCSFLVTVIEVDEVPPQIISCPTNIIDSVNLGTAGMTVTWAEPTSSDNSGTSVMSSRTHAPGTFFTVGTTTVTYTFSDPSGNDAQCSFTVTIVETDLVDPIVLCPEDIVLTILTGTGGTSVEWTEPTATDNSGVVNRISQTAQSGQFFGIGVTTVTYQYSDNSGNIGTCSFDITVDEANPCFNNPCANGGTCVVETLTTYTCLCQECYSGQTCEISQDACSANLCSNGAACVPIAGSCTQYQCECTDCYFGQYCTQRVNPCDNNQCQNGAQCVPDANDCTVYYCQCPTCYSGQFCQVEYNACTNHGCQNGGQCVTTPNGACTEYTCSCSGCFTGELCQEQRDPCANSPCGNNGVCSSVQGSCNTYTCECQGCFTGYNCEIAISNPCANNPCANGGQCSVITGQCAAYTCTCPQGFTGINCGQITTTNINPCNSFPCVNGGSCLTMDSTYYICVCPSGYLGINCQTTQASLPGFNGCGNNPCANGATCYNSFNSNNNFNGNFNSQYTCVCTTGFSGTNCALSTGTNPSLEICNNGNVPSCDNGGVCRNAYHSYDGDVDYFCECPVGFIGHNCETVYFDPCTSNPCFNGGQCTSFNNYFACQCSNGYAGTNCNIDIGADNVSPVISNVPSSQYYYTTNNGFSATWVEPTATDNSGTANLVRRTYTSGSFFPLGTTAVTYVFSDPSNNAATATFFVTVIQSGAGQDLTAPTIVNCPGDISVVANAGASSATASWNIPTATDNSGLTPSRTATHSPSQSFGIGSTVVTYTFSDNSGNTATCSFTVTVQSGGVIDQTPPAISNCPNGVTVATAAGASTAVATWTSPTATDNSGAVPSVVSSHQSGQSFNLGSTQVSYTFTDGSMNSATCSFVVTVVQNGGTVDMTAPVISGCPDNIVQQVPGGAGYSQVSWTAPTATDNSGTADLEFATYPSPSIFIGFGMTINVEYRFADPSGNTATCSFNIQTVAGGGTGGDTVAPVIAGCPGDVTGVAADGVMSTVVTWTEPTASDNTAVTDSYNSHNSGDVFPVGVTSVVYGFLDAAGNEATCRFEVTVTAANPDNPCNSNPCPLGTSCYYTTTQYICLDAANQQRNRRDVSMMEDTAEVSDVNDCGCYNGGRCVMETNNPMMGVRCECPAGFNGVLCEVRDPCQPNPCANNGTCHELTDLSMDGESAFLCQCAHGWEGPHCLTALHLKDDDESAGLSTAYAESFFLQMSMISTMTVLVLVIMILALVVFRMSPRGSSSGMTYNKRADEMPIIS